MSKRHYEFAPSPALPQNSAPTEVTSADPGRAASRLADRQAGGAGRSLIQLQRDNGNRHVQQVVAQAQTRSASLMMQPVGLAAAQRSQASSGQRMPGTVRSKMERSLGVSFADVRIHQGAEADAVDALAYTQGSHIYFRPGEYRPHTHQGQLLLGHELTHVVQQRAGRVATSGGLGPSINADPTLESEAMMTGFKAANGEAVSLSSSSPTATADAASAAPIQRTPKWLKKILRGIGVMAPHGAAPAHGGAALPATSPIDDLVTAYEKSRYYHQTGTPGNVQSLADHGLLNQQDRIKQLGKDVGGMSRLGGEYAGDEKKGVFMGPKHFMQENRMTQNVVRLFLPAERTVLHHWDEDNVPPNELMRDEKFRGGAVISKNSVPANQVLGGSMMDLIEEAEESPAASQKLAGIVDAIASQYDANAPTRDEMVGLIRQAILVRRLSNAAFDI